VKINAAIFTESAFKQAIAVLVTVMETWVSEMYDVNKCITTTMYNGLSAITTATYSVQFMCDGSQKYTEVAL